MLKWTQVDRDPITLRGLLCLLGEIADPAKIVRVQLEVYEVFSLFFSLHEREAAKYDLHKRSLI